MPPKKRQLFNPKSVAAKMTIQVHETSNEREIYKFHGNCGKEHQKQISAVKRSRETSQERDIRRAKNRIRNAATRARETVEEKEARLAVERERKRATRARENSETKEIRRAKNRMRQAVNRANETLEETRARKINDRIRHMELRSRETSNEREIRLAKDRARHAKYRSIPVKDPTQFNIRARWLDIRERLDNVKNVYPSFKRTDIETELSSHTNTIEIEGTKPGTSSSLLNNHIPFGLDFESLSVIPNIKTEPRDLYLYRDSIHENSIIVGKPNVAQTTIKRENSGIDNFLDENSDQSPLD